MKSLVQAGAIVTFVGPVWERNEIAGDGAAVDTLTLEHYPGMTERSIAVLDRPRAVGPCRGSGLCWSVN